MFLKRCASLTIVLAASSCLHAQYTAGTIVFKNADQYAQGDLESVAQLHPHDKFSRDAVQAAAQRLIDTGYFDDVGATLEGPVAAISVIFKLKPLTPAQMTPVGYENLIWLTPEERDAAIHKTARLFQGRLPAAGNQTDAVASALQTALAAKGVTATVTHDELQPSLVQPERAISFRVEQSAVLIHALSLRGVSPELAPQIRTLAARLRNTSYSEGPARPTTSDMLLQPYFDAGYIAARLDDVQRVPAAGATASSAGVDISGTVSAGEVFHVSSLTYAGTPVISSDAAMKAAKLHPGDIASHKLLLESLQPIDDAYRHLGYMDVFVDPGAKLDEAAHTVSYSVTITPGMQYRIHSVTANGFTPAAQTDFEKVWMMNAGALYDPGYVTSFLKNNTAVKSLQGYSCSFRASADPQSHLVDLTLMCVGSKMPKSAVTFN